jgi:hypothetical protein
VILNFYRSVSIDFNCHEIRRFLTSVLPIAIPAVTALFNGFGVVNQYRQIISYLPQPFPFAFARLIAAATCGKMFLYFPHP